MHGPGSDSDGQCLADGATELGVNLSPSGIAGLLGYLDLLYAWNSYAGFTAIPRRDAVRLHLLDSLALVPFLGEARTVVDLGSGAGLPGIPLALAVNVARVTLVESKRRRCSFLRETVRHLDLQQRVQVIEADARGAVASQAGLHDAVVARAFAPPADVLILAAPLLSRDGLVVLMGGGGGVGDLSLDARGQGLVLETSHSFHLPGGREARSITTYRKRPADCFT